MESNTELNAIKSNLELVRQRINVSYQKRLQQYPSSVEPRLVAVTKIKTKQYIIEAYNCGQIHFGENYIQELYEKSTDSEILELCPNIKWHIIGHIQTNKVNKLLSVPNLYMIETIDSLKLAESINNSLNKRQSESNRLKVMVQINTSGEENKSGIESSQALSLVEYIINSCANLQFVGLMTIGAYDFDTTKGPNPDFIELLRCRQHICDALKVDLNSIELSMGMTADYAHAVEVGSTNVRVGSAIFGERQYH